MTDETLFSHVIGLPPERRSAYLDEACARDTELRLRVEERMRAHDAGGGDRDATLPYTAEEAQAAARQHLEQILQSTDGGDKPDTGGSLQQTPEVTPVAPSDSPIATDRADATVVTPVTEMEGNKIGRYKLLQCLGEGGCGVVYMAEQEEPVRRKVALKVIKLGMDTRQVVTRFEAERQALAMMDHQNIAKVFDAGASETGRPYFVMELVRGTKITDFCDQQKFSTRERLQLFIKVCAAIQHAHQKGIIHRDLKPSNILVTMIDGKPVAKVIDFGIAKATNPQQLTNKTLFTAFEQLIGTPAYMSPEQADLGSADIDTRSDIYSLGVVLYELLTGHTPFDGVELMRSGVEGIRKTLKEREPLKPSTLLNTLKADHLDTLASVRNLDRARLLQAMRGDLDWVAMKCLDKDRARRYATANALAADLQRHLDNEPIVARPPTLGYLFQKSFRRNRLAFAAGLSIAAALIAGTAVSVWQALLAKDAQMTSVAEAERATDAEIRAKQKEREALRALAKADITIAERDFEIGKYSEVQKKLDQIPEEYRDANWRFLQAHSQDFTAQLAIPGKGTANQLQFLPQGDRFAARFFTGSIGLFTLARAQIGSWISAKENRWETFGIDRTGGRIAFPVSASEVAVQEVATGQLVRRWTCQLDEIRHVLLSPDGETVLAAGGNQLAAYAVQTGAPLWAKPDTRVVPAFSQDGSTVAVLASKDGLSLKIQILDTPTGAVRSTLEASADHPDKTALQFNQAGDRLACLGGDEVILWNPTTSAKIRALHFPRETAKLLSPDGGAVATVSGGRIRLWDTTTGRLLRSFNGASTPVMELAFSPDGMLLLSSHVAANDAIVHVWPTRLREETASVRPGSLYGGRVMFGRDGSTLYSSATNAGAWETGGGRETWRFATTPARLKGLGSYPIKDMVVHPIDGSIFLSQFRETAFIHLSSAGEALEPFGTSNDSSLRFNSSGKLLLAVDQAFAKKDPGSAFSVMEYPSGKIVQKIDFDASSRQPFADFCLDDAAVATAALTGGITVWDWEAGTPLRQIDATQTGSIACLAASPDGLHLARGGPDRWIRVWEAATGRLEAEFRAHWEGVSSIDFSLDGTEILSGSEDGTVRIHDAATGEERLAFYGLTTPVANVDISADGRLIAAITEDGLTKVWDRQVSSAAALLPKRPATNQALMVEDGWDDLFARLTPAEVEKTGHGWLLQDGELFSPDTRFSTLPLPSELSDTSYQVRVKLRRLTAKQVFHIILPVADRMCGFELEGRPDGGIYTGLILVNGKHGKNLPGLVQGQQVNDAEPHDLEVTVRLDGAHATITSTLDGRPLHTWNGPTDALSQLKGWATTPHSGLALGTYAGGWAVSEVKLKKLGPKK